MIDLAVLRQIINDNGLIIQVKNDNYDETECLMNIADDLELLLKPKNNGWISVDDGLPANGSICFVLREKIDVSKFPPYIPAPIHFMNSYYCRVDKTIYKDDHFVCDENSREKVTHWVLAPEEPKE